MAFVTENDNDYIDSSYTESPDNTGSPIAVYCQYCTGNSKNTHLTHNTDMASQKSSCYKQYNYRVFVGF